LPVFACISIAIALSDGLPLLFRQIRVGYGRRSFTIYKFRTMRNGSITAIGRLLRATGLDELPQLANIALGHMAFVGPRPLTPEDVDRLGWNGAKADARWSVLPGITGLAQLSSVCAAKVSLHHDVLYARKKSLLLDAYILVRTAAVPFRGKRDGVGSK
jgi:lipopolysaccharide/colanic/teichoic acid biosynthesis glycosyltransferase